MEVMYVIFGAIWFFASLFSIVAILDELKRQGRAREAEARQIIALLASLEKKDNP